MKKMKSAFTLAEVLITLGIIGIIAAIILPSVMSNYQYKSVGVKLAKFLSTTEGAARAWAVNEGNFTNDGQAIADFVNDTFIIKEFTPESAGEEQGDGGTLDEYPAVQSKELGSVAFVESEVNDSKSPVATLKDGTGIQVYLDSTEYSVDHNNIVAPEKYGAPVFRVRFTPNVQGLPNTARNVYDFTVTELGYVFPHENDPCTWELFNSDFSVTSRVYQSGRNCHRNTSGSADNEEGGNDNG